MSRNRYIPIYIFFNHFKSLKLVNIKKINIKKSTLHFHIIFTQSHRYAIDFVISNDHYNYNKIIKLTYELLEKIITNKKLHFKEYIVDRFR